MQRNDCGKTCNLTWARKQTTQRLRDDWARKHTTLVKLYVFPRLSNFKFSRAYQITWFPALVELHVFPRLLRCVFSGACQVGCFPALVAKKYATRNARGKTQISKRLKTHLSSAGKHGTWQARESMQRDKYGKTCYLTSAGNHATWQTQVNMQYDECEKVCNAISMGKLVTWQAREIMQLDKCK